MHLIELQKTMSALLHTYSGGDAAAAAGVTARPIDWHAT
jgi:hypothetical protein